MNFLTHAICFKLVVEVSEARQCNNVTASNASLTSFTTTPALSAISIVSMPLRPPALVFCRKRLFSTSPLDLKSEFRTLLRESAQPVAVVTTKTKTKADSSALSSPSASSNDHSRYHGATLSSFTSIAMDPHPLVAFSLRIPSRMATYLSETHKRERSHSG